MFTKNGKTGDLFFSKNRKKDKMKKVKKDQVLPTKYGDLKFKKSDVNQNKNIKNYSKKERIELKKQKKFEKNEIKRKEDELKTKEKTGSKRIKQMKSRARGIEKQKRKEEKKKEKLMVKKLKENKKINLVKNDKVVNKKLANKQKEPNKKTGILHLDLIKKVDELTADKKENENFLTDISIDTILEHEDYSLKPVAGPEFCSVRPFNINFVQKQEILQKMGSVNVSKTDLSQNSNMSQTKMMPVEEQVTTLPKEEISNISAKENFKSPLIDQVIVDSKDKSHRDKKNEKVEQEYFYSGIAGFDSLLEKGIPTGANIIVAGGPGCGKTIFCSQTIYNIAAEGKDCVFLSMEERPERLKQHMLSFGFDVKEIERSDEQIILRANGKGRISLKRLQPIRLARSIEALLEKASGTLPVDIDLVLDFIPEDFDACLLALDSISAIETAFSGTKRQYRIYIEQLFRYFEDMNITTFMITESMDAPKRFSNTGVEEFLADGIFVFYNFQGVKKRTRGVEVFKLRGASHSQRIVPMEITSNGIKIDSDESCKNQV